MSTSIDARFPKALKFLFKPARYKVARGGRGSGKSWGFARALILRCVQQQTRILCTREIQKNIQQSVHQLLSDQIEAMGLSGVFEVLQTEIRGPNESQIFFSGLSDITATGLKSFEGVDIVWCEEAQAISAKSWKTLVPTIRKEGSEIWVTYNPELESDPTHQMFVVNPPPDCVSVLMNWTENPYFPETLRAEREHAEKTMKAEEYRNVWEGECLPAVTGAIYFDEVAAAERDGRIRDVPADPLLKTHAIWDLGWNDSMSILLVQRSASELRVVEYIEDSHRTLDDYARQLKAMPHNWGVMYLPHDGFSKDFKTGKSAQEILEALGWAVEQTPNMDIEGGIRAARMSFGRMYFDKTKCARLIQCLKRYRRHINKQTLEAGSPLHDEFSHGCLDGDTLIKTSRGSIPIRDVLIGDMVDTPAGFALVTNSAMTKIATEVVEITTVCGQVLIATPEHPIFTTRGVVCADALSDNDSILTLESAPCLSFQNIKSAGYRDAFIESFKARSFGFGRLEESMVLRLVERLGCFTLRFTAPFTESQISGRKLSVLTGICATHRLITGSLSDLLVSAYTACKKLTGYAFTSSQRAITKQITQSMAASPCTGMYGSVNTELSAQDFMCIMSMGISQTTTYPTWSYSLPAITARTTEKQILGLEAKPTSASLRGLIKKPKHGIQALKELSGIRKMALLLGLIANGTLKSALSAVNLTKRLTQAGQSTAIRIAKLRRITGLEATRPVYDLTVDKQHCYIANGMLVSNCDAFRYTALVADALSNSNGSSKPIVYKKRNVI